MLVLLTNSTKSIEEIGAARQISAACRQFTTVPRKYITNMPTELKSWVTVHRAPRIEGSLDNVNQKFGSVPKLPFTNIYITSI